MNRSRLSTDDLHRYQRQILLAPIGGAGQLRIKQGSILLHGRADLAATYLVAAGLGRLLVTGERPELAARDPIFELVSAAPGDPADVVLDLGDGAAWRAATGGRLWGGVVEGRLLLGHEPKDGATSSPVLETLAAGEALRRLLGETPHSYQMPRPA